MEGWKKMRRAERPFESKKSKALISLKRKSDLAQNPEVVGMGQGAVSAFGTFLAAGWGRFWVGRDELHQSGSS